MQLLWAVLLRGTAAASDAHARSWRDTGAAALSFNGYYYPRGTTGIPDRCRQVFLKDDFDGPNAVSISCTNLNLPTCSPWLRSSPSVAHSEKVIFLLINESLSMRTCLPRVLRDCTAANDVDLTFLSLSPRHCQVRRCRCVVVVTSHHVNFSCVCLYQAGDGPMRRMVWTGRKALLNGTRLSSTTTRGSRVRQAE